MGVKISPLASLGRNDSGELGREDNGEDGREDSGDFDREHREVSTRASRSVTRVYFSDSKHLPDIVRSDVSSASKDSRVEELKPYGSNI